ncbi:MAG: CDP-diacylglycerol--glycerol-3-phosphate 3-phosphatidyltransferase, partial [Clostridia bacterium]|nr:CDP-diacylglycerol--glycerol-3-phosphate 3-phosphatidyltransferase [Clostridia bacterium]
MNLPNRLTLVRICLVPLYMALLVIEFPFHYAAALLVFIIASLTDYFDGKIARARNLVTNLGKFLDPIADKMLTTAAFLVFLGMGYIDVWAVMLVMTREFMVTSVRLMAAGSGTVVAASFAGKMKTVMQYVAIIAMMTALQWSEVRDMFLPMLPEWSVSVPILVCQILI